jgi:transposase
LLSAAGDTAKAIARVTGLSIDAVTDIRRRWKKRHLRSLVDRRRRGRPPRVTMQYRMELRRALRRGPQAFRYVFTVWSIARLKTYLAQRTGIVISSDWLRRLVRREEFVVGRPKHTLKGKRDPLEYQRARSRLNRLKKGHFGRAVTMNCGTLIRPNSNCCRTWCAAGCQKDANLR